ncbi:UNVERIFIED_CONTAM: hypothetical protein Sangu_1069900 [Sesamum angustifolium]|uniref:Uncharacterized protein n=1 Tax=Sesamum angustifolium TaxID=2727405 RepID=A0AAW2NYX8_9LAMI
MSGHNLERGKATDCKVGIQFPSGISAASETSRRDSSKRSLEWIKPHSSAKDKGFASTKPFKGTFLGSSRHTLPYYDLEKHRSDKGKSTACLMECNTSLLFDAPSTSDHHLPTFGRDWFQKCPGNGGVKLQPLSSSSSSEGKRNIGDLEAPKVTGNNESSAETDTMDMNLFKEENPNSGANSAPSTEGFNIKSTLSTRIDVASSKEVGHVWMDTSIPDINLEPPALHAAASSSEDMGPSSSRTQSLEVDVLLAHSDQPNPKTPSLTE